jgi:predicted metalloprotease
LLEPVDTVAFYCPADGKIYFDKEARAWITADYGEVAWTIVMAHEWGHHVQFHLDPLAGFGVSSVSVEQQADCLAGAYLADALARDWIDETDLDIAWQLVLDSGDSVTHGTASDRLKAIERGLDDGPPGCDVDL